MSAADTHATPHGRAGLAALSLAALGVVYGDIGTSPIYALREALHTEHGVAPSPENVLGLLSLIFWALIIVISIKYLIFVMRADNCGEGGMIALTALVTPTSDRMRRRHLLLVLVGLFGASLLYGDGMITPAISVLSAVEGLQIVTPVFRPYVVPITIAILIGLFLVQSRGTARIGSVFGPVMLLWFLTLGVLGAAQLVQHPGVLAAVNPAHGVRFLSTTAGTPSWYSAPFSSWSRVARRYTQTWGTSVFSQSGFPGLASCFQLYCSTTSVRARSSSATPPPPNIHSSGWRRAGR